MSRLPVFAALLLAQAAVEGAPITPPVPGTTDPKIWAEYLDTPAVWRQEVDLRQEFNRLGLYTEAQGSRPSCAVFALTGALELQIARLPGTVPPETGKARRLSEDFLIWGTLQESREVRSQQAVAADIPGFSFEEVVLAIRRRGLAWQDEQPNTFVPGLTHIAEPLPALQESARKRWDVKPLYLNTEDPVKLLNQTIALLNAGVPVVIGLDWPEESTLIHAPVLNAQPAGKTSHGVLLVGYWEKDNERERRLIFRNSYGPRWGRAGHGFISPEYFGKHVRTALFLTVQPAK